VQYTPAATMRKPPPMTTPCTGETSTFSAHTGRPLRATRVPARAAAGSTKALHVAQRASIHREGEPIIGLRTTHARTHARCRDETVRVNKSLHRLGVDSQRDET
jgi:hypothetical protein